MEEKLGLSIFKTLPFQKYFLSRESKSWEAFKGMSLESGNGMGEGGRNDCLPHVY